MKNYIFNIITELFGKVFMYWETVKFTEVVTSITKFLLLPENLNFITGKNSVFFFFLEVTGSFHSFPGKCLLNT